MSRNSINLTPELERYVLSHSLHEPTLLTKLREETARLSQANMQISPLQGQFMSLMTKITGCKRALEIGTFTGYSALIVAMAMPEDGALIACDVSEEWTSIARRYWEEANVSHKIELKLGPALVTLDALIEQGQQGSFDMAFIDADKSNYAHYYERALTLLRPGGLILIDNVLWSGSVCDPQVQDEDTQAIRALNALIQEDKRVELSMLPIGDGLSIVRKLD